MLGFGAALSFQHAVLWRVHLFDLLLLIIQFDDRCCNVLQHALELLDMDKIKKNMLCNFRTVTKV